MMSIDPDQFERFLTELRDLAREIANIGKELREFKDLIASELDRQSAIRREQ